MTYTFWHSGVLIGESDLEDAPDHPRRRGGIFRPTAYGKDVYPRLSGILTAGHELKTHLDAKGLDPDEMDADEVEKLFDSTPAAQKVLDVGRMLSEVEMRAPDGKRMEFSSIAFIDVLEMERLIRELEVGAGGASSNLPSGAPRYFVSATLCDDAPVSTSKRSSRQIRRRHWSEDN